jgi:hypothetical protein
MEGMENVDSNVPKLIYKFLFSLYLTMINKPSEAKKSGDILYLSRREKRNLQNYWRNDEGFLAFVGGGGGNDRKKG